MIYNAKMFQKVYIITYADRGINILACQIVGAHVVFGGKIEYLVDHCGARFLRFSEDIFSSVEEIAQNIKDYVIE